MSQPTPYTPTSDFSQQEANNASGRSTVNTAALDVEFANIETTLDTTLANLALIQRDDGNLSDETVGVSTLTRDVLHLIGGFVNRGDWVTATAYAVNDIVAVSGYLYQCVTAHTSSASFVTDSAKWLQFGFKPSDGLAAAAAQAAIDAHIADASAAHQSTAIQHGGVTVSAAIAALESDKASLDSPALTGTPTAPTAAGGDSSSKLANTAFVANAVASILTGGATLGSLGAIYNSSVAKTTAYTVVSGDKGKVISCDGTFSLSLTAAASLGDGFAFAVANTGAGVITIDPNGAETIDGATTITVPAGKSAVVYCDAAKFVSFGNLPASLVTSVGGNTGPVTNAQVAAAATAGYGYTPANPAALNYVGNDVNGGVGTIMLCSHILGTGPATGATIAGSSLRSVSLDYGVITQVSALPGTWRNLGPQPPGSTGSNSPCSTFQRIA